MTNPPTPPPAIEDILNTFRQSSIIIHAQGSVLGVEEDVRAFKQSLEEAHQALKQAFGREFIELVETILKPIPIVDAPARHKNANIAEFRNKFNLAITNKYLGEKQ